MKLYWRYKKNGKWTWQAARVHGNVTGRSQVTRKWMEGFLVQAREEEE